jgi:hypothetical protein
MNRNFITLLLLSTFITKCGEKARLTGECIVKLAEKGTDSTYKKQYFPGAIKSLYSTETRYKGINITTPNWRKYVARDLRVSVLVPIKDQAADSNTNDFLLLVLSRQILVFLSAINGL